MGQGYLEAETPAGAPFEKKQNELLVLPLCSVVAFYVLPTIISHLVLYSVL